MQLVPASGPTTARETVDTLALRHPDPDPPPRPYTIANFVASADGRAAFAGRSGTLSDPGDRALFHALRERVDAVIVGTGTLRKERYGRVIPDAERRRRRLAAGRAGEPLAVTATRSGELPLEIPLFASAGSRVVVFAPAVPDLHGVAAAVEHVPLNPAAGTSLASAMAVLSHDHGVQTLLCEGGPTLFGALLHAGLIDELFLTLAPRLAGGDSGPPVTTGPPLPELAELRLVGLLRRGDTLYLRYAVSS